MQRMIDTGTWDDPWFADLSPDAKLLFLYLLTNRRSTAAGAFEITIRAMAFETGLAAKRIDELLPAFGDRVCWWPDHQIIWVRNFFKRQAANEKFTISAQRVVAELPVPIQCVIGTAYPNLVSESISTQCDTHGNGYPMGMDTPSLVIDREIDREEGSKSNWSAADATVRPPLKPKGELTDVQRQRFDRWYSSYPRKVSKAEAVKAWSRINPTAEQTDQMVAKVLEWAASDEWSDAQYIPHPASWLNAGRWEDGAPTRRTTPNGSMSLLHGGNTSPPRQGPHDRRKGYSADELMEQALELERVGR